MTEAAEPGAGEPMPAAKPLASARGLGVRRAGRWLVHDVDLAVGAGEIVTLIGPNGGGKSTVLRALLGLIRHDAGEVRLEPGVRVGYLPQRVQIESVLPLTVGRLMTLTQRHPREDVVAALAETGVEGLVERPVQALSGGELQRVLLARAMLRRPELLVLDEPVQGVDYAGEAALYALIAEIRRRLGCGVLLVSHDLHMVMAETDRVICLNHHVCCTGTPRDVTEHSEFRRLFGSRALAAYAVYRHSHDHAHDLAGEVVPADAAVRHRH